MRLFGLTLSMALLALGASTASCEVTTAVSKRELKCQIGVARALSEQAANHARCVRRCEQRAAKTGGPYEACEPPAYGGETLACIIQGEERSRARMRRACPEDGRKDSCPEEYEGRWGSCAGMADARVAIDHGQFGAFTSSVVCEHQNFVAEPRDGRRRSKCQTKLAGALVAHFGALNRIYARCNAAIVRGRAGVGACVPGATTDPRRSPGNVVPIAGEKTAAKIDAACFSPRALAPTCYDGSPLRSDTGAGWVALVNLIAENAANGNTFLASPSGAFVDEPK